jgi:alpha-beta hydrolase superfamily lysophospholipase
VTDQARFTDSDGVEIAYRTWSPRELARGAVVVLHGASDHSGRYARIAEALADRGWAVFALDQRGHGLTAGSTGAGCTGPRGLAGILDDVEQLVGLARGAVDGSPVVVLGHSLGSIVAVRYAELRPDTLRALILSGPIGLAAGADEMIPQLQGAVAAGMGDVPVDASLSTFNAAFEPARTPYDWLSRDESEVDGYIADPLCGDDLPVSYGWALAGLEAARDGLADVDRLPASLPVLVVAGERDPASDFTKQARELVERMRGAGVTVTEKYYPEARHEVLNETNRDEVQDDILQWLDKAVPARS